MAFGQRPGEQVVVGVAPPTGSLVSAKPTSQRSGCASQSRMPVLPPLFQPPALRQPFYPSTPGKAAIAFNQALDR